MPAPPRRTLLLLVLVYAIESDSAGRVYIGYTGDIESRLKYHNSGFVRSTAIDKPWRLIAFEEIENKNKARWLERSLKKSRGMRLKWLVKNQI